MQRKLLSSFAETNPMQLQPAEVEALESSAGLLKYAVERPVQLPQDLVAAITTA